MNSTIKIFYKTDETLDHLDNQFADELDIKCNLIFLMIGAISGLESYFKELDHLKNFFGDRVLLGYAILSILLGAGTGLLIGRYIITYILYGIGLLLKGNGETIDIRVISAYSMIPIIVKLPVILYLGLTNKYGSMTGYELWAMNGLYILIWVLTMKIMIQGLAKFNKYGYLKAIINSSPFLLIGFILHVIACFKLI